MSSSNNKYTGLEIAIIGISCRFPGAANISDYWDLLKAGKEAIRYFEDEELKYVHAEYLQKSNYIKAKGIIDNVEYFDAEFFGYKQNEALLLSPQSRIFHECVWEALEDSGYNPSRYRGSIGLYAGASSSLHWQILTGLMQKNDLEIFTSGLYTDKDYLSTRVSYQMNLRGPSITVNTACSTSLVSLHLGCRALLTKECDMAIVGGVTVGLPLKSGYFAEDGMIESTDGHCRPFDAKANGTVFSDGAGVVVLKPLADAIKDQDNIHALILSSAINNDGRTKVGFTAPSTHGQIDVISQALKIGRVLPDTIGYIETHGTGTQLGDPIEIEALKQVFKDNGKRTCAVGSVKSNIGHLDAAAGISGVIKVILSLKNKKIPPSINFETPNDKIDFENSPFYVNTSLQDWQKVSGIRRAGVSSFGIGGTNAHIILQEAPERNLATEEVTGNLFLFSALSKKSLKSYVEKMHSYIEKHNDVALNHISYTQNTGRKHFPYRYCVTCNTREELLSKLKQPDKAVISYNPDVKYSIVFMFGGVGAEYLNMGKSLYLDEPFFKQIFDEYADNVQLKSKGIHVHDILFNEIKDDTSKQTLIQHNELILCVFELTLSKYLLQCGVKPFTVIGHGIGELIAACFSGIISYDDILRIIFIREEINKKAVIPDLLNIQAPEEVVINLLKDGAGIAAINNEFNTVVAISPNSFNDNFITSLKERNLKFLKISNYNAFNTEFVEPYRKRLLDCFNLINLKKPAIRFISSGTGKWISDSEVLDRDFWIDSMLSPIRFSDALNELLKYDHSLFIEIGPSMVLSSFVSRKKGKISTQYTLNLIRHEHEKISDIHKMQKVLGQLWEMGLNIDVDKYYEKKNLYRVSLPNYSFDREKYWVSEENINLNKINVVSAVLDSPNDRNILVAKKHLSVSETELFLVGLWRKHLGNNTLNSDDNLFDWGVTSLDAININKKIKEELNVEIPVTTLMTFPTIKTLAAHIVSVK